MAGVSFVSLLVATFILSSDLTLAHNPPASMVPPAMFGSIAASSKSPAPTTPTTTAHITTTAHHTTANHTTAHTNPTTTPSNATTAHVNITTTTPSTHHTTANLTTPHTVPITTHKPGPTPPANLTLGNYTVKAGNNLCIMVQAAIQVNVSNSKATGVFKVQPNQVSPAGSCNVNMSNIDLKFKEGNISLNFIKNDTTKKVYVNTVSVNLIYAFSNRDLYNISKTNKSVQLFSMKVGHSYSCKSESVFLGDGINLEFSQQRIQAFNFSNNQFGPLDLCKADEPNYNVAIAVGVVLIVLIIIVLIAYFFSRRKRTDGYQTL
ncbi:macrosialin isoform X3 [Colossoma macropomum]|uniref:macrosialin isoform X2 n=1 Tax=Colossoma macropomum TaxID=42526 RepID=UPI00186544B8|nr:macrosialin isoform X2 [Colossoma macropomum]XP_036452532.1 macrosialin isoform X3 [Colossoma macropomum]